MQLRLTDGKKKQEIPWLPRARSPSEMFHFQKRSENRIPTGPWTSFGNSILFWMEARRRSSHLLYVTRSYTLLAAGEREREREPFRLFLSAAAKTRMLATLMILGSRCARSVPPTQVSVIFLFFESISKLDNAAQLFFRSIFSPVCSESKCLF